MKKQRLRDVVADIVDMQEVAMDWPHCKEGTKSFDETFISFQRQW